MKCSFPPLAVKVSYSWYRRPGLFMWENEQVKLSSHPSNKRLRSIVSFILSIRQGNRDLSYAATLPLKPYVIPFFRLHFLVTSFVSVSTRYYIREMTILSTQRHGEYEVNFAVYFDFYLLQQTSYLATFLLENLRFE